MQLSRRALPAALAALHASARAEEASARALDFPRDHGAHPAFGIEWWYATGWLHDAADAARAPRFGFQVTFFRSRTGLGERTASRFAARQLLFAHAALTDLRARRFVHAERLARWRGDAPSPQAFAATQDTQLQISRWSLRRAPQGPYTTVVDDGAARLRLQLTLAPTQPLLLQGDEGFSRKGPAPHNASHYYSQPQLAVEGRLMLDAQAPHAVRGRAWLDHEWSGSLMPERAVGWDWIGINLDDGGALTAFRLRDAAGAALWAGGSLRAAVSGAVRAFAPGEVRFEPLAWWTSAATRARYPVRWRVACPAGTWEVRALLDIQEVDSRASTGAVYWEGLSELRAEGGGARTGLGYLEMTGYVSPLRLG